MSPFTNTSLGNDAEFNRLSLRYRPALIAFFLRRTASHADAEDMTQDLFLKLSSAGLVGVENPDAYIFQMAANLLKDRARRFRTRSNAYESYTTLENLETEALDPSRFLLGKEQLNEINAYLADLPERTRTLFVLFRVEGISQNELAAAYGISRRTVQNDITKALNHIVERLKGEGRL